MKTLELSEFKLKSSTTNYIMNKNKNVTIFGNEKDRYSIWCLAIKAE